MTGLIHNGSIDSIARRITMPQRFLLGSNLTGCSFFIMFFYFQGGLILLISSCLIFYLLFHVYFRVYRNLYCYRCFIYVPYTC